MKKALIIAGASSGLGKTSLSIGLSHSLATNHKLSVQTFKVGPDFLDPTWLSLASQRESYNLDTWMSTSDYMLELYNQKTKDCDIALIEGVMGLFDGALSQKKTSLFNKRELSSSSTAEIANKLSIPILLILNAGGMAQSFAAMVYGFTHFYKKLNFMGVIANYCGSPRHAQILKESLNKAKLPPLLGYFLKGQLPPLAQRHLGLHGASEDNTSHKIIKEISSIVTKQIDLNFIIERIAEKKQKQIYSLSLKYKLKFPLLKSQKKLSPLSHHKNKKIQLAIAWDKAFYFYYKDNLELLQEAGFNIQYFSPLYDSKLPQDLDMLYIGGGYPELYAKELSQNQSIIQEIRDFVHKKKKIIYAECGGLSYLSQSINTDTIKIKRDKNSIESVSKNQKENCFPLVSLLPLRTRMTSRFRRLGYVETRLEEDCILGNKGLKLRGHEFHYSEIYPEDLEKLDYEKVYTIQGTRDKELRSEGYYKEGVLASYVHQHFSSNVKCLDVLRSYCSL